MRNGFRGISTGNAVKLGKRYFSSCRIIFLVNEPDVNHNLGTNMSSVELGKLGYMNLQVY